jgi:hypothetical protein
MAPWHTMAAWLYCQYACVKGGRSWTEVGWSADGPPILNLGKKVDMQLT